MPAGVEAGVFMMDFLRKYQVHILGGVLAFFLLSIAFQFGSSFFVRNAPNDPVAKVNGEEIPLRVFDAHFNRALAQRNGALDANARAQMQQETLRDLIQMVVFKQQAKRYGVRVPDAQVVNTIASVPQFHNQQGAFDPQLYGRFLQFQARSSANDFEEEQRQSIAFFKMRWLVQSCVHVTTDEFNRAFAEQGAEFAKTNAVEMQDNGKKKHLRTPDEIRDLFHKQLIEEKSNFAIQQWFQDVGKKLEVKTYPERFQMGGQ
jgi:hypothetical protein